MKFTLVTFIAIVGAASAISVDAVKRQCIAKGGLCFTSIADTKKPCCGGLELQKRAEAPAAPQPRGMPQIPDNEPRWG
uniref:Ec20 protein n=1 Tax=Colletotrichum fructicola (strain Nara gc5) TaxID=1213859 RepID=L2FGL0_COLFN